MNAPRDWTLLCLSCGAVVALSRLFSLYTSVPCTWVPGYLGTWVPGYLGTWVPGYLGTWVPGYLGKHVRFCSRKHVHFFAITRTLFVYVLSQIEKKSIRVIAIYPIKKFPAFPYSNFRYILPHPTPREFRLWDAIDQRDQIKRKKGERKKKVPDF